MLTPAELRNLNEKNLAEALNALKGVYAMMESAQAEAIEKIDYVSKLKVEIENLEEERDGIHISIASYRETESTLIKGRKADIAELDSQIKKMTTKLAQLESAYKERIEAQKALYDDFDDKKKELEEWERSLRAKTEALRNDRQAFNLERRRLESSAAGI